MNKVITLVCVALVAAGCSGDDELPEPPVVVPEVCEQDECWNESLYVCRDQGYIDLFTRDTGWTGGDATYSVQIGADSRIWLFGDTFIDQVNPDRSRPGFRLINNSLVLQEGEQLTTFYEGSSANPDAFAKPPEEGHWYWPGDGTYADGRLFVFMHGFANEGGGAWDFFRTSVDLLEIDPQTMEILSNRRIEEDPEISWGAAVWEENDVTYVYGVRSEGLSKTLYVARTSSDLSEEWEYFSGENWVADKALAAPLMEGVSEQFSVFRSGTTWYLLTHHNLFGKEIYLYTGNSPEGPFGDGRTVYCTPETGGDLYTYNAFVHEGAYTDSLLVSYNLNSFDIQDLLENADNYRPYFIRIGNWKTD